MVIGRRASQVPADGVLEHVFGYTILNDVTARDLQREDRQWLRAKSWDGFAPLGPVVVTRDEIGDPGRLALRSSVNGETWQESSTAEMIWDVPSLIAFGSVLRWSPATSMATAPRAVSALHDARANGGGER